LQLQSYQVSLAFSILLGGFGTGSQERDFPDDIYEEITFEAHRQNRTIAQKTVILIKKGRGEEMSNKEAGPKTEVLEQPHVIKITPGFSTQSPHHPRKPQKSATVLLFSIFSFL
jgi:hypothetical protein